MASGDITISIKTTNLRAAAKEVRNLKKEFKGANISVKAIDKGVGSLGNRLGFVAFQMTFLAGVAGRALGEITQRLNTMVQEGSKDLSTVGRAIVRSGFDISASTGKAREAVDLLNNAMRTFGSGTTVFNVEEVAGAFDAVGRAVNFAGDEVQRAKQQIIVANEVIKLMTIENQSADSAAINFVKTMKIFSISVSEAAKVSDVLVAVNNQSTITLDGLVRSLGFAGQQAREFGLTFEETAAVLGVVQDRLGVLNGGPGRNLSILLQNLSSTTVSLSTDLASMGITLRDTSGQMKGIVDIVGQFNAALKRAGKEGSIARKQIFEMINATSRGERTLLALVQGFDELNESIDAAEGAAGIANRMSEAFKQLPEERIKRMKNAFNSLRIELVGAMSPAIAQLVIELRSLATDSGVQTFMQEFGTTLSQLIIPPVKTLVKLVKGLTAVFKGNEFILKLVTGGFAALLGVLASLFIIGTVGALVAVMGAFVQKLAASTALLTVATNALFISFLKFAVAAFGIFLILKGIDQFIGVVKDGFEASEAPALAMATAMIGLGGALTVLPFMLKDIGKTVKSGGFISGIKSGLGQMKSLITVALAGIVGAFRNLPSTLFSGTLMSQMSAGGKRLGGNIASGMKTSLKPLGSALGGIMRLAMAHPFIAIAIAAVAMGAVLGLAIKQGIKDADDFGMDSAGQLMVSRFGNALASMSFNMSQFIRDTNKNLSLIGEQIDEFLIALTTGDWTAAAENFQRNFSDPILNSMQDIAKDFASLGLAITNPIEFKIRDATRNVEKLIAKLESEGGFSPQDESGLGPSSADAGGSQALNIRNLLENDPRFLELIKLSKLAGNELLTQGLVDDIIKEYLDSQEEVIRAQATMTEKFIGMTSVSQEVILQTSDYSARIAEAQESYLGVGTANQEQILTTENVKKSMDKYTNSNNELLASTDLLNLSEAELAAITELDSESLSKLAETQDVLTARDNVNITETQKNSLGLAKGSATLELARRTLNAWILEVARNQNRLIDFTLEVDKASIAFSLLAREGAEAARRLSTLKVSDEGVFSISGLQTAGVTSGEVAQLGSGFEALNQQFHDDLQDLNKINLEQLVREQELINELQLLTQAIVNQGGGVAGGVDSGIQEDQLNAINTFEGDLMILDDDLQEIIKISSGQAHSLEEFNKLVNFTNVVQKSQPTDADLGALVNTINREDNTRSIAEILGSSLDAFLEAILNRDVNLDQTSNIGESFTGDLDRINGQATTDKEQEIIDKLGSLQSSVESNGSGDIIITNEININVDGIADETTAEEVADIVAEKINSDIENKDTLIT